MSETLATPPKKIKVETVETIHRTYEVEAPDEETAVKRLRAHWTDPESLREGIVRLLSDKDETTSKQVRAKK